MEHFIGFQGHDRLRKNPSKNPTKTKNAALTNLPHRHPQPHPHPPPEQHPLSSFSPQHFSSLAFSSVIVFSFILKIPTAQVSGVSNDRESPSFSSWEKVARRAG
jgi:hypothetical protein